MPICTVRLLHGLYIRLLTVKSEGGAHCIFCPRAYNTLSPPLRQMDPFEKFASLPIS